MLFSILQTFLYALTLTIVVSEQDLNAEPSVSRSKFAYDYKSLLYKLYLPQA